MNRATLFPLLLGGVLAGLSAPAAALQPGSYRCASYNVSGGGGSCRNVQPLILNADGSYRHSSTQGRWSLQDGQLILSASQLWGPGEVLGDGGLRFEYDYRGWRHLSTWLCENCQAGAPASAATAGAPAGAAVGVSLTLAFDRHIGGVSGFVIVPHEAAADYTHNAPLPAGAVQGLAWETDATTVQLSTGRSNTLISGRRYVVFLAWPRETLPVALLDLPPRDGDFSARLPARLDLSLEAAAADW